MVVCIQYVWGRVAIQRNLSMAEDWGNFIKSKNGSNKIPNLLWKNPVHWHSWGPSGWKVAVRGKRHRAVVEKLNVS